VRPPHKYDKYLLVKSATGEDSTSHMATSTTGDLNGAVARLGRELRQLKYTSLVDEVG